MSQEELIKAAMETGVEQAKQVLRLRDEALRRRDQAFEAHLDRIGSDAARLPSEAAIALSAEDLFSAGVLVAEGDSWFDYPFNDVLQMLEDHHAYDVESVAHKGDEIEEMAYGGGQLEELTRRLEKIIRRGVRPKAILLSGGGNDIAGDAFGTLINHARSANPGLNMAIISAIIEDRLKMAYVTILRAVTEVCLQRLNAAVPILVHGYDYPVPDGRGFLGGWGFLPGPWLEPGFRRKGFEDIGVRIEMAGRLIDLFNEMLAQLTTMQPFAHVHHVDLRDTLSHGADYRDSWANELHPTRRGFEAVTEKFARELQALP